MDYKQLSAVVDLMGGTLSYSLDWGWHQYTAKFGRVSYWYRYPTEQKALDAIEKTLKETYRIKFKNALNQLNLKL